MGRILRLSIRSKILLVLLIVGLGFLAVGGILGYRAGEAALTASVEQRLVGQRETKRNRVEAFIANEARFTAAIAAAPRTLEATKAFIGAWTQMRADPQPFDKALLLSWYNDTYLPSLDRVAGGHLPISSLLPEDPLSQRLQTDYIARNPHPPGQKIRMTATGGTTPFDIVHTRYHEELARAADIVRFHDIMLVDASTGDVVYTTAKEPEFATNVFNGPYARAGLGRVVNKALDPRNGGGVVFEDFSIYAPAGLIPQMFSAYPIADEGRIVGVLVAQLDVAPIDGLLNDDRRWRETGQGDTGEVVLVGQDQMFRSQSRFLTEAPDAFFRDVRDNGLSPSVADQIRAVGTTILYLPAPASGPAEDAFRGHSGIARYRDYRGKDVIAAYGPLRAGDFQWAIWAKQDVDEAFAPITTFRRDMLVAAAAASIVLTLAAMALANVFTRPLRRVLAGMQRLRSGIGVERVPVHGDDEFADLANGYNALADAIVDRDRRIEELNSTHANLLRSMYPEGLAERVRSGATIAAETVSNVTVVVAWIDGLDEMMAELDAAEMQRRLSVLFEQLAKAAAAHGVEPLRSLGESWFGICGLSSPRLDHAARAVAAASEAANSVQHLGAWAQPLSLRFGISSGELDVGILSRTHATYDVWGRALAIARRIAIDAGPGEIRVSGATFELLTATDGFEPCAPIQTEAWGVIASWTRPALQQRVAQAAE